MTAGFCNISIGNVKKILSNVFDKEKYVLCYENLQHYLVVIRKNQVTLTLNKPEHVGMCNLGLSKVLMNEFHYDYIKNKYGDNSRL